MTLWSPYRLYCSPTPIKLTRFIDGWHLPIQTFESRPTTLSAIKKTYWFNEPWFAIAPFIRPKSQKPEGAKRYSMAGEALE
jgi:hypothetical protein